MSRCYDMDVCFDGGCTETPRLYPNFKTSLKSFLHTHRGDPYQQLCRLLYVAKGSIYCFILAVIQVLLCQAPCSGAG